MNNFRISVYSVLLAMLITMPLIDTINGMMIRNSNPLFNLGQVYRVIFFALLLSLSGRIGKRNFGLIFSSFAYILITQLINDQEYRFSNIASVLKLFIPILMIYVFMSLNKKKKMIISDVERVFEAIGIMAPLTIIIPYFLGIGYRTYGTAGYIGFYYATNEISFVISSVVMYSFYKCSKKIHKKELVIIFLNLVAILLLGTKSGIAVFGICLISFGIFTGFKTGKLSIKKLILVMLIIVAILIGLKIFSQNISDLFERWSYGFTYNANRSIVYFLSSGRIARINDGWRQFHEGPIIQRIFGWGLAGVNNGKPNMEMDYIDLLYGVGWIGAFMIVLIHTSYIKQIKWNIWKLIIYSVSLILVFAGGHILYGGLGGMMYALDMIYLIISKPLNIKKIQ